MSWLGLILVGLVANADVTTPTHRFVFEFTESPTVSIKKMQVDLLEKNGQWFADTVSLAKSGEKKPAYMPCKKSGDEFDCARSDNGGGFKLGLKPTPKLIVERFTADDEGDDISSEITSLKTPAQFTGKKAVITEKDAF